ncbi:MAG: ribonuclease III [Rhodospirillaceae bacterium]|nr:ribonuclease III [Rhodospirillaceae bacterium]
MAAASREPQSALENVIGHRFADPSLLARALTHRSVIGLRKSGEAMEHAQDKFANERLEFLGDRVLGLVIAELLIDTFPDEAEGQLAQRLALLVSAPTLARVARASGMAGAIRMAPGQTADDIDAVLADACEAVIGAMYVDGGMGPAKAFILSQWTTLVSESQAPPKDAKSTLQEWAQGRGLALPAYAVHERSGPDHAPNFNVTVSLSTGEQAQGAGRSKRIAEQAAAAALLAKLGEPAAT